MGGHGALWGKFCVPLLLLWTWIFVQILVNLGQIQWPAYANFRFWGHSPPYLPTSPFEFLENLLWPVDSLLRPENNYSHSGYSSYSQQSRYVDDVIVSGNMPDCQNGVPYEQTILSYPLTEINADYTIGTLIHPAYTADSSIFEIVLHFDLAKQNVGRRRKCRSILAHFWFPCPMWVLYPPKLVCVIKQSPWPTTVQNIALVWLAVRKITPTTD